MVFSGKAVLQLIFDTLGGNHGLRKVYLFLIPGLMFLDWSKYSGHKNKEMAKTMLFLTSFTNKQTIFVNFIRIIHNIQYKDA
jgi:hypothetical protein